MLFLKGPLQCFDKLSIHKYTETILFSIFSSSVLPLRLQIYLYFGGGFTFSFVAIDKLVLSISFLETIFLSFQEYTQIFSNVYGRISTNDRTLVGTYNFTYSELN